MVKKSQFSRISNCDVIQGEKKITLPRGTIERNSPSELEDPSVRASPSIQQTQNIGSPQPHQHNNLKIKLQDENYGLKVQKLASAGFCQIKRRSVQIDNFNPIPLLQAAQKSGVQTLKALDKIQPDAAHIDYLSPKQMNLSKQRPEQKLGQQVIQKEEGEAAKIKGQKKIRKNRQSLSSSTSSMEEMSNRQADLFGLMKIDDSFKHSDSEIDYDEQSIPLSSSLVGSKNKRV